MRLAEFLSSHASPLALAKGTHLFRQGQTEPHLYSVASGTLKAYYLQENGAERIKSFLAAGDLIGSLQAATLAMPSPFSLVALEDCQLLRIDFQTLQQSAANDLELSTQLIQILIDLATKKERREYEFLCLTPEQRYHDLVAKNPAWLPRVTQADIALYLGIAPESLSRIRRRQTTPS